jgi:hypothetical protein
MRLAVANGLHFSVLLDLSGVGKRHRAEQRSALC